MKNKIVLGAIALFGLSAQAEPRSVFFGQNLLPGQRVSVTRLLNLDYSCGRAINRIDLDATSSDTRFASTLSLIGNGYELERQNVFADPYRRAQYLRFSSANSYVLCQSIQSIELMNTGRSPVYVGTITVGLGRDQGPQPPRPQPPRPQPPRPQPPQPQPPRPQPGQCENRDMGKLTVRGRSTGSKMLSCRAGEYRVNQSYTGTSAPCSWELGETYARLTCRNDGGGDLDADHTYIECCRY